MNTLPQPTDPVDRAHVQNLTLEITTLPIGTLISLHGLKIRRTSTGIQWRRANGPRHWEHDSDIMNAAIRLYNRSERRLRTIH